MSETVQDHEPIIDVNDLASKLMNWHDNRVLRLQHMLSIPIGTEVELDGEETLVLEGATLSAFRLGIQVALSELGQLPIVAHYETDD